MQSFFSYKSVINHHHINRLHLFWDSFEWFCFQISCDTKYSFHSCPRYCDQGLIVDIFKSEAKKNTLLVVELWAVTWVPFILRHPIHFLCYKCSNCVPLTQIIVAVWYCTQIRQIYEGTKRKNIDKALFSHPESYNTRLNSSGITTKFATVVEGDQNAPFSIATTRRCSLDCSTLPITRLKRSFCPNIYL